MNESTDEELSNINSDYLLDVSDNVYTALDILCSSPISSLGKFHWKRSQYFCFVSARDDGYNQFTSSLPRNIRFHVFYFDCCFSNV